MASFSSTAFSIDAFSELAFDFGTGPVPPVDNGWLGGTFNDPYYESEKRKAAYEKRLALEEAQREVIRLKTEQQELRLQEIEALKVKDKQTKRQLNAMARKQAELANEVLQMMALIERLQQENKQRNAEALLILAMAYPWLNIGGETMH